MGRPGARGRRARYRSGRARARGGGGRGAQGVSASTRRRVRASRPSPLPPPRRAPNPVRGADPASTPLPQVVVVVGRAGLVGDPQVSGVGDEVGEMKRKT